MSAKTCRACGTSKPYADFYASPQCVGGVRGTCKSCEIAKQRTYAARPEVKARRNEAARTTRKPRIRSQWRDAYYRLAPGQADALLAMQGGGCGVCRAPEPGGKGGWHVDHDHRCCPGPRSCGECVRGLLCARCNPLLGFARDDTTVLLKAAAYLNREGAVL